MANEFLTPDVIAMEALVLLESNLVAASLMDRSYQVEFTGTEKIGDTVTARRRDTPTVNQFTEGGNIVRQNLQEHGVAVVLERHFDVSINVTSRDMTLELQDFSEQILAPSMLAIAEEVDTYALTKLENIPTIAGPSSSAPAELPNSIATMAQVDRTMNEARVPQRPRYQLVSPEYKATLLGVDAFTLANQSGDTEALRNASLGNLMGFESFMDQNIDTSTHTSGTATTGAVNGAVSKGATSINVDGFAGSATLVAGDVLVLPEVNGVAGGAVVAADVTLNGSGAGTVTLAGELFQDLPDNAAISVYDGGGNTRQNHGAVFHPRAFTFVTVPLELPSGAAFAQHMENRGLSVRAIFDYDTNTKTDVLSLDVLVGAKLVDQRLAQQIVRNIP